MSSIGVDVIAVEASPFLTPTGWQRGAQTHGEVLEQHRAQIEHRAIIYVRENPWLASDVLPVFATGLDIAATISRMKFWNRIEGSALDVGSTLIVRRLLTVVLEDSSRKVGVRRWRLEREVVG